MVTAISVASMISMAIPVMFLQAAYDLRPAMITHGLEYSAPRHTLGKRLGVQQWQGAEQKAPPVRAGLYFGRTYSAYGRIIAKNSAYGKWFFMHFPGNHILRDSAHTRGSPIFAPPSSASDGHRKGTSPGKAACVAAHPSRPLRCYSLQAQALPTPRISFTSFCRSSNASR